MDLPTAPPPPCTYLRWILSVIFLALVSVSSGTPNLYPSNRSSLQSALNLSDSQTTLMLTGGVLLLYVTFPAGLFMDRFGATPTLLLSSAIVILSYAPLPYCSQTPGLYIFLYLVMSFGSASVFVVSMQIALARSPPAIKGVSLSIVSASMSLSLGLFLEIFKAGQNACRMEPCAMSGVQLVSFVVCPVLAGCTPVAWLLYRAFPQTGEVEASKSWGLLLDSKLYILLVAMWLTTYDGMIVVSGGSRVWEKYGRGYPKNAEDWGIWFSVTNCVFSIGLSVALDFVLSKCQSTRPRLFAVFWLAIGSIPAVGAILFRTTDDEAGFGVFMSAMGIPFGFGLTQVPALVSEAFGNDKYGFAFGIVQVGAIAAAASTMPIIQPLEVTGITVCFAVAAGAHIVTGILVPFFLKKENLNKMMSEILLQAE